MGQKSRTMLAVFAAMLVASISTMGPAYAADKPNILFTMGDDIGWFNVGA